MCGFIGNPFVNAYIARKGCLFWGLYLHKVCVLGKLCLSL